VLFTSYKYAVFVVVAFSLYYLASRLSRGRHLQNLALLLLSYLFYALWDWRWCCLLTGVTASGYVGAAVLARVQAQRSRGLILLGVLLVDLGALGAFKYFSPVPSPADGTSCRSCSSAALSTMPPLETASVRSTGV